jgi:hypothetical protein
LATGCSKPHLLHNFVSNLFVLSGNLFFFLGRNESEKTHSQISVAVSCTINDIASISA